MASQDLVASQGPTGKLADQLDGYIREGPGGEGRDLADLMLRFCQEFSENDVHVGLADLMRYGVVYESNDRYLSL
jgi:hypothetical protein